MGMMTMSAGGVPVGEYTATFSGIDPQPANVEKGYGAGIRWKFTIDQGPQQGQTASRITSPAPTMRNSCGKMLSGLLGRTLADRESADPAAYIGKRYRVLIGAGQGGGTRIEFITPIA
jgi:hypothetical protein